MTVIVLINGEKQSGKSTLAEHAANLLMENGLRAEVYSLVGIYQPMLESLFEAIYGDEGPGDYEDMKRELVVEGLPFTGRDWMIQIGNASRALHPHFLPAIFAERAKFRDDVDVWLIENWGFQDEWEFFRTDNAYELLGDFRLVTVSLTERSSRQYMSGEQYDGDNRFNLDAIAEYVNPKVNELAAIIDPAHEYPIDTILQQFGAEVRVEPNSAGDPIDDEPVSDIIVPESELDNQPSEAVESDEANAPDAYQRDQDDGIDV